MVASLETGEWIKPCIRVHKGVGEGGELFMYTCITCLYTCKWTVEMRGSVADGGDVDGPDGLGDGGGLPLGDGDGEDAVVEGAADGVHVGVEGQPEAAEEAAAPPLRAVPRVSALLLLPRPLPAYLQYVAVLHMHVQLLPLHPFAATHTHTGEAKLSKKHRR